MSTRIVKLVGGEYAVQEFRCFGLYDERFSTIATFDTIEEARNYRKSHYAKEIEEVVE